MRQNPSFAMTDAGELRRVIDENPWMTLVSATEQGLVASHYAVLLDEDRDDLTVVGHVGKPDDAIHGLGEQELLVIVQGPHGYITPNWYAEGDFIPTWNHVTAHLYGVPELLSAEENFQVLHRLTDHFEQHTPEPRSLHIDEAYAERIAKGTVGLRIRVTRFDARAKLSQSKSAEVRARIIAGLRGDGAYADAALAHEMERLEQRREGEA